MAIFFAVIFLAAIICWGMGTFKFYGAAGNEFVHSKDVLVGYVLAIFVGALGSTLFTLAAIRQDRDETINPEGGQDRNMIPPTPPTHDTRAKATTERGVDMIELIERGNTGDEHSRSETFPSGASSNTEEVL